MQRTLFSIALLLFICNTLTLTTASKAKWSDPLLDENEPTFVAPRIPELPTQFRAKARLWLKDYEQPLLLLYHHDALSQRTREDYYSLLDSRHQRVYSTIRFVDKGIKYMIFHKQEKAPRACFIVPSTGFPADFSQIHNSVYMGKSTIIKENNTITCDHFRTVYESKRTEFCLDEQTGQPLVFESVLFRLDVLHLEAGPQSPNIFDPNRASLAQCGVIGAPKSPSTSSDPFSSGSAARPF